MADLKQARALLDKAKQDLRALQGMRDESIFAEEIFGFHTQQAIEKALKAWIALRDHEIPRTHALSRLLDSLEQDNQVIDAYWGLLEYQIYAVQFRYEIIQADTEPLDREQAIYDAAGLIKEVEQHFELELAKQSPPSGSDI